MEWLAALHARRPDPQPPRRLDHLHFAYERETAAVLGLPYELVMQVALIPVAYTIGTEFKPGPRTRREQRVHWDNW